MCSAENVLVCRILATHDMSIDTIMLIGFYLPEMDDLSIFRNYKEGEPSRRLYIKNLAKQVTEEVRTGIKQSFIQNIMVNPASFLSFLFFSFLFCLPFLPAWA